MNKLQHTVRDLKSILELKSTFTTMYDSKVLMLTDLKGSVILFNLETRNIEKLIIELYKELQYIFPNRYVITGVGKVNSLCFTNGVKYYYLINYKRTIINVK